MSLVELTRCYLRDPGMKKDFHITLHVSRWELKISPINKRLTFIYLNHGKRLWYITSSKYIAPASFVELPNIGLEKLENFFHPFSIFLLLKN